MAVIQGKVKWASLQQPNTTFEPVYSVDVVLDKEKAVQLKKEGLPVKKNDDGEFILKAKRKAKRKDGSDNTKPRVVDGNKNPVSDLIGNGSLCNVQYQTFDWSYAGKSGIGVDLIAVQVLELVPYSGGVEDEFDTVGDTTVKTGDPDDFDDDLDF